MRKTQPQSETCERERCPHCHTLLHLDSRRCWACQKTPEEWAVESQEQEARMPLEVVANAEVDVETGQPTLDPEMFPAIERRQVPVVKITFAGTVEMTQTEWEAYCDQGLEPGRVVKVALTGYLPNPHAKWVRRSQKMEGGAKETWWEKEGQVKVKALELGRLELRGFYDAE